MIDWLVSHALLGKLLNDDLPMKTSQRQTSPSETPHSVRRVSPHNRVTVPAEGSDEAASKYHDVVEVARSRWSHTRQR